MPFFYRNTLNPQIKTMHAAAKRTHERVKKMIAALEGRHNKIDQKELDDEYQCLCAICKRLMDRGEIIAPYLDVLNSVNDIHVCQDNVMVNGCCAECGRVMQEAA